jgi:HDOD domain
MPQAVQDRPSVSTVKNSGSSRADLAGASLPDERHQPARGYSSIAIQRDAVSKLTRLLEADPVDLAEAGDAIRALPDLEAVLLKLCDSPTLASGIAVCNAEEAAIVLGKDRLRILVRTWSARQLGDGSCSGVVSSVLARDLLLLMPLAEPMLWTPEQRAALEEMLQFCR